MCSSDLRPVGVGGVNLEGHGLQPRLLGVGGVEDLDGVVVTLGPAGVHAQEHLGEVGSAAMGLAMNCLLGLLALILFVLELAYIRHYYQLENGVQRLYELTVMIDDKHQEGKI